MLSGVAMAAAGLALRVIPLVTHEARLENGQPASGNGLLGRDRHPHGPAWDNEAVRRSATQ